MSNKPNIIWVARPEPQASQLAQAFAASGMAAIAAPVMDITPIDDWGLPTEKPDALIITSQHAVAALKRLPEAWKTQPVYTAGNRTAEHATEAGWQCITSDQAGAKPMIDTLLNEQQEGAKLLYLSGDVLRWDIPAMLADKGYTLKHIEVYHAKAADILPEAVQHAIGEDRLAAITCYSPRTAQIAAELLRTLEQHESLTNATALCLSDDIANAARKAGFGHTAVSRGADEAAMVQLAITTLNPDTKEPIPMRRQLSGMFVVLVALIGLTGLLAWQNMQLEKKLTTQPAPKPVEVLVEADNSDALDALREELQEELALIQEESRLEMDEAVAEMEATIDVLKEEKASLAEEKRALETKAKEEQASQEKAAQDAQLKERLAAVPSDLFYSWYALRHAYGAGKNYQAEIVTLQAILPDALNQTSQMKLLVRLADKPAPIRKTLVAQLVAALDNAPSAAPVTVTEATPDEDVGVMARMQHLLNEHVTITRATDAETEAMIATVREHITHDEIETAARILHEYPAPWPELSNWLNLYDDMQQRRIAIRQLGNIMARFKGE